MESSSESTQRSMPRGRGGDKRNGPPVSYYEGPFDYEPEKQCYCHLKAARLTSWSDNNPGRRYYRCHKAWSGEDCGYYVWHDPESEPHMKKLLKDMRDRIYDLRNQNANLELQLKEASEMNDVLIMESVEKSASLKEIPRKLVERDADAIQQAMPRKISAWNCSCFVFVVLAFLFGLVLSLAGSVSNK